MKHFLAFAVLGSAAAWAADPTPLDVKTGQWESTVTTQMTGMPQANKQMPQIPPEQLAKLPPDQRARIEAMMKQAGGQPTTTTSKYCVKKEDLAKLNPANNADKSCKTTVVSSSHSKLEMKMECDSGTSGTVTVEATSSESMKFNVVAAAKQNGQTMNMTINGTSKYLGSTCTDSK